MEPSQDSEPVPSTPPVNPPAQVVFSAPEPVPVTPPQKSGLGRVAKIIGMVLLIIVVLAFGAGVYVVHSISSYCDNKTKRINTEDALLKAKLHNISINGQRPDSVESVGTNTDCIDGSEQISVGAHYTAPLPTVTIASAEVFKSLGAKTTPLPTYTPDYTNNNTLIDLSTNVVSDKGEHYSVSFTFTTPFVCHQNGQIAPCVISSAAIQTYDLMNQPVGSISLGLTGDASTVDKRL